MAKRSLRLQRRKCNPAESLKFPEITFLNTNTTNILLLIVYLLSLACCGAAIGND